MKKSILLILVTAAVLSSCEQPLYIPNTMNVPVLTKKGDIDASLSTGSNGNDLQAAYAITDEIGVMVNTSYANHQDTGSSNFNKHAFVELGLGYTFFLNKESYEIGDAKIIAPMFVGYGMGSASGYYSWAFGSSDFSYYTEGKYSRIFFQPAIGMSHKSIDIFFSLRMTYVNFSTVDYQDNLGGWTTLLVDKDYNLYYEPTLTWRVGGEKLKFMNQVGVSAGQFPTTETSFRNRPVVFIVGLQLNTNLLKKQ